jgi:hypothetical protein
VWGRLLRCSCTACLLVATATSASGACATALGGSPCRCHRKNVSASTPCITRPKMSVCRSRSSSPDETAVAFADSLLSYPTDAAPSIGQKRDRIVVESLELPEYPLATIHVTPSTANALSRGVSGGVVEESCVVASSQASLPNPNANSDEAQVSTHHPPSPCSSLLRSVRIDVCYRATATRLLFRVPLLKTATGRDHHQRMSQVMMVQGKFPATSTDGMQVWGYEHVSCPPRCQHR